jgi:squalene-hopene/tetraprenyl-beta-curcumene cyclase
MSACRPVTPVDARLGISELFLRPPGQWPPLRCPGQAAARGLISWERFFRSLDALLKWLDRHGCMPLRKRGIAAAEAWMIERFAGSEGLGAIFPPMVWSIVALKCLGYDDDSPEMQYAREHLDGLIIEEDDTIRLQPCKSPVWDTAITLRALDSSGVDPRHPRVSRAVEWLLDQEIRRAGDWRQTVAAEPGGWCFEHANDFYPDLDDTVMVLMALQAQFDRAPLAAGELPPGLQLVDWPAMADRQVAHETVLSLDRIAAARERAEAWVLAMQNRDGGWGAFDRDNDREFLCHVPFADHNAMIDPSTPDLTGRVLETLGQLGRRVGDALVDRAVAYMRGTQEADGSWFGRWGVNYIYGTWQALAGLAEVGLPPRDPAMVAGANWLLAYQQPSGGWGESPDSYAQPHLRGQGPTTASQTAWAILGLLAAGCLEHPAVARGIRYLLNEQQADGTWHEREFTGTGFPRVFYLRYHMYPVYFPLLALSRWAVASGACLQEARAAGRQLIEANSR